MKELVATIYCQKCAEQKGSVYAVLVNSGVSHNVTEPLGMQNRKTCPDCATELTVTRIA